MADPPGEGNTREEILNRVISTPFEDCRPLNVSNITVVGGSGVKTGVSMWVMPVTNEKGDDGRWSQRYEVNIDRLNVPEHVKGAMQFLLGNKRRAIVSQDTVDRLEALARRIGIEEAKREQGTKVADVATTSDR